MPTASAPTLRFRLTVVDVVPVAADNVAPVRPESSVLKGNAPLVVVTATGIGAGAGDPVVYNT